jgi:uncharacterized repeat protein (TIGR03803 family)
MFHKKPANFFLSLTAMFGFLTAALPVRAADEIVLHNFTAKNDLPYSPMAGVIFDSAGNLYGTTIGGGDRSDGAVFELTLGANGRWTAVPVYSFIPPENEEPDAGLIFDSAGNLYGTTLSGGIYGQGTVFELSRGTNGLWTEKLLHSFAGGKDGYYPQGPLSIDTAGNVYGTTVFGGTHGRTCDNRACGTVFELSPGTDGAWTETVLHSFQNTHQDGGYPDGGVVLDAAGNLYGTTELGGVHSSGTVFEMSLVGGTWTESILHNFCSEANCTDGSVPFASLVFDAAGNLYGTTQDGGSLVGTGCGGSPCGTVFELSPGTGSTWTESVLYSFCSLSDCADGALPSAGRLVFDAMGNLYGTTGAGGLHGGDCDSYGCGTVFELTPSAGGVWSETVLYKFPPNGAHGLAPSGLVLDSVGNLFGTTANGGLSSAGTVFEVTP